MALSDGVGHVDVGLLLREVCVDDCQELALLRAERALLAAERRIFELEREVAAVKDMAAELERLRNEGKGAISHGA